MNFAELNLDKELERAIEDMGFEETTPIQSQAIPYIRRGRDVIGQAQTGTGKTAAFGIPIIEKVSTEVQVPQALIICPTRELAVQVSEELRRLAKYIYDLQTVPIYGGQPIKRQIRSLNKGVQVVIGTPGRLMDHMRRKTLVLDRVETVVLDEADVMLDMGFIDDIETILRDIPDERQTLFFSATIPRQVLRLKKKYQKRPEFVKVVHEELTVPSTEQYYFKVRRGQKVEALTRLLDLHTPKRALVFCNTRKQVEELSIKIRARGYMSDALHGGLHQSQRDRVMDRFKNGIIEVMVATDVAARGIDIRGVECVFNYDLPQDIEYYVHRIGRTGRAGREGKAFSFVVGKDIYKLKDIEKFTRTRVIEKALPSAADIRDAQIEELLEELSAYIERESLNWEKKVIETMIEKDHTSIEVAAALLKMVAGEENEGENGEKTGLPETGAEPGMVRLFINAGNKDEISPRHIVGAIAGETGLPGTLIGAIDIHDRFTFVEVPRDSAHEVLEIMEDNYIKGNQISIEPARPKQ